MKLIDIVVDKIFRNSFTWCGGLDPKSRPFLFNAVKIMVSLRFSTLLMLGTEAIKNSEYHPSSKR